MNDIDATAETETESEVLKGTRSSRGLFLVLIALASLAPLSLLALPSVQAALASVLDFGSSTDDLSYDPSGPVVVAQHGGFPDGPALILTLAAMAVAGVLLLIQRGIQRLFADRIGQRPVVWTVVFGAVASVVITLVAVKAGVVPYTDRAKASESEPANVAQWVEERYGLDVDESTAETLVDEAQGGGDPVLIEGRLLNLTRIAQGGYVLTDDKSATELPTRN